MHLVEGNREDFDLIIQKDRTLILLEAKIYSPNNIGQTRSKIERLDLLKQFFAGFEEWRQKEVTFRYLAADRRGGPNAVKICNLTEPVYRTERCSACGKTSARGEHFRIVRGG